MLTSAERTSYLSGCRRRTQGWERPRRPCSPTTARAWWARAHGDDVHVETHGTLAVGGAPVARDSLFRVASITKPIVAAAVGTLLADGALTLDEPVDRLLPELADPRVLRRPDAALDDTVPADRPIRVRDVLDSTCGYARPWSCSPPTRRGPTRRPPRPGA